METTLQEILETETCQHLSLLKMKQQLIGYKRRGIIYTDKCLSKLTYNEPFQLYYAYRSSKRSRINAFPVPIHQVQNVQTKEYIKEHFGNYYTIPFELELFFRYEKTFVGTEYVWYTRPSLPH